jgi:alpha-tubulin suppressor-like RCC1 family protein
VVGPARTVQCWGANDLGQLGRGTTGAATSAPAAVSGTLAAADQLAAGANHTCALASGAVRCWGANAAGQSGTGIATTSVNAPGAAAIASGATAIAAGGGTSCASTAAGGLLCWGNNNAGQTGRGTSGAATSPAPVIGLPAAGVLAGFAVGANHACASLGAGAGLHCWGDNGSWQLGDGGVSGPASSLPVPAIDVDNQARFDALVGGGAAFTCATRSGEQPPSIKCGGQNAEQQAGPRLVPPPDPLNPDLADRNDVTPGGAVLRLSLGSAHGCALVDDVTAGVQVKCWGRNAEGQLGRPTSGGAPDGVAAPVPP